MKGWAFSNKLFVILPPTARRGESITKKTSKTDMNNPIQQAATLLRNAQCVIALTGAGVSTESGIPDFRSKGGLWSRFDPMTYGTLSAFHKNPAKVWEMLRELISIAGARPNSGHIAMAELERNGILKGIITQNIDMLHQKAGSENVIEFHGSINSLTCLDCGIKYPLATLDNKTIPPVCSDCRSLLKPDVVFFDEQIPTRALINSQELARTADCLLVAGTSCQVIPASLIPDQVYSHGGRIIELNIDPELGDMATVTLKGSFATIMPRIIEALSD